MPENKNQHYVPQFYFRNFSKDKKKVNLFHLQSEKFIDNVPIATQCSEDYFYGKREQPEKMFSDLEGKFSFTLRKIIDNGSMDVLDDDEQQFLKSHMLFHHGRTKYTKEKESEMLNYFFDELKSSNV